MAADNGPLRLPMYRTYLMYGASMEHAWTGRACGWSCCVLAERRTQLESTTAALTSWPWPTGWLARRRAAVSTHGRQQFRKRSQATRCWDRVART
nr:hypothetical protein CFP56_57057 [Quercus suber]